MFSNNEEKKLDWMYKGPSALVEREDYLLGRTVDKTLEQLNEEEKNKATNQNQFPAPKNHVEHECIPPSIRDYNKIVQSEQVDVSAKLQEDPLMLIRKLEDETRRQFLQNPVQLKKLQDAMQLKNKKKHKEAKRENKKLRKKLKLLNKQLGQKNGYKKLKISSDVDDEKILNTILMHKFNLLRNELSEDDLKNIVMGNFSDSEDSESDEEERNSYFKSLNLNQRNPSERNHNVEKSKQNENLKSYKNQSPDSNYKNRKDLNNVKIKQTSNNEKKKKLSEDEKEALRRSMMEHAAERNKESKQSYKKYKKEQSKPETLAHHSDEFIRNEFLKSANSISVADRIKANVNNIQRSKSSMESNFLK